MQDRLKFRVWDKENKCLHYPTRYSNFTIINGTVVKIESYPIANSAYFGKRIAWEFDDAVIMQSTGLKDKNGKLIYEGDIVKIEYYDFEIKHRIGIVEWEDDGFCITYHNPKDTKVSGCSLVDIVNGDKQEVIGNIYENPELL